MKQNDINRQFSENNNATFSSYVALIASFIAVFYLYVWMLTERGRIYDKELFLISNLVIIVLALVTCLSINLGYSRRRDHVVACYSDRNDPYVRICNGLKEKSRCNYLLGAYKVLYWFFELTLILFTAYSSLMCRWEMGWYSIVLGILGSLLMVVSGGYYLCRYNRYKDVVKDADTQYPQNAAIPPEDSLSVSNNTTNKVNVNINL